MAEKGWSEDPEDDPVELQKEQLALGREFLDRLKKQEAEEKKRQEEHAKAEPVYGYAEVPVYKPPTFEEVSGALKKAWDEVERIMPGAPEAAKSYAFQTLVHAVAGSAGRFGSL